MNRKKNFVILIEIETQIDFFYIENSKDKHNMKNV